MNEKDLNPEEITNHIEEEDFEYTQEWLQENTQIRGWLLFFMIVSVLSAFRSIVGSFTAFIWTGNVAVFVPIIVGVIFLILTLYTFSVRKPSAIFYIRCFLFLSVFVNFYAYLYGEKQIGIQSHCVILILIALFWLFFLTQSKVVEEVIPSEYRAVKATDYITAAIGFIVTAISLSAIY